MTGQIVGDTEWNGLPMPRRLWAILAVTFGVALSVLDGTIANVALPTIAHELGVSSADSIWVVNAYQLAIVVSLLSFSTLGDVVGYRRIYIGGLVFFTLSSVGCAFAGSLEMLIAMRVIQGFGGAAVVSINTSIIRIIYPRDQLGRGMGINATVVAIASVAGPTLAAAILSMASWHWLFAINIPIGIAAVWLSMRFLPYNPVRLSDRRFDWRDGVMNALTFGLLIASVEGFSHGLDPRIVACGVSAFCVVGYLFVRSQLRKPYSLLPFDLLRIPIFSLSVFTSICSFVAQMLALVALPFFLQKELGYSDVHTGLLLTAWPAVIVVVAPVAGLLVERVHAGVLGGVGLTVMAAGLLLLALLPDHPTDGAIIWRLVVCGAGFGLFQSPNNSILIASAPAYRSGSASGMLATARLIGQTTGAALMALFFHLFPSNSTHLALYVSAALALARWPAAPAFRWRCPSRCVARKRLKVPPPRRSAAREFVRRDNTVRAIRASCRCAAASCSRRRVPSRRTGCGIPCGVRRSSALRSAGRAARRRPVYRRFCCDRPAALRGAARRSRVRCGCPPCRPNRAIRRA